jgi:hypothetical protein
MATARRFTPPSGYSLPRKRRRVQPTAYLSQSLAKLTLGFKAFPLKLVKSGFNDPSCVVGFATCRDRQPRGALGEARGVLTTEPPWRAF